MRYTALLRLYLSRMLVVVAFALSRFFAFEVNLFLNCCSLASLASLLHKCSNKHIAVKMRWRNAFGLSKQVASRAYSAFMLSFIARADSTNLWATSRCPRGKTHFSNTYEIQSRPHRWPIVRAKSH